MRRVEVSPAAVGSLALHAGVAAALMISWGARDLKVGSVVPVTIVSNAPDLDVRPAVQGPTEQTAMTETPVPDAAPQPEPPAPEPPPTPAPKAAPKPIEKAPTPAPKKAQPKPAEKTLDLDALAASLSPSTKSSRPAAAPKGPSRAETATTARDTAGSGLAAGAALSGLAEELQRRWNPNCEVEGGGDVQVRVTFVLGAGGNVAGEVTSEIRGPRSPVARAAAERAVRAVYAAAPFRTLPREFYGDRIAVNFNAREACARR